MQKIVVSVLCLFILTAIFKEAPAQSLKLVLPIGHNKSINTTSFSPDNKLIVTASDDKTAKIWELPFGRILATLGDHNKPINAITFSPDGQFIFTSSNSVRCELDKSVGGGGWQAINANLSPVGGGSVTDTITADTVYSLTCWNADNVTTSVSATTLLSVASLYFSK